MEGEGSHNRRISKASEGTELGTLGWTGKGREVLAREEPDACSQISVSKGKGARESWESDSTAGALGDAGTGILGLGPSTARKPQSFTRKRNLGWAHTRSPSWGE